METTPMAERKLKQKYLREHIVQENLDPEEFSNFLNERRPNGTDIDVWTFDELIQQVQDFLNMKRAMMRLNMNDESGGRRTSIQNEVYQNFASNRRADEPQSPPINIVVLKTIRDEKFVLRVLPLDREITRTLQDVYTLRANLCVEFPYYYIPPVVSVDNKANFIQNFFWRLLDMRIIHESTWIRVFIDDEEFKKASKTEPKYLDQVMLDKMIKLYQNPARRATFAQNEAVFDQFLGGVFHKYESNSNNEQFYEANFAALSGQCQANAKSFSNLKHLCYQLMDLFQKTSDTINYIATAFRDNMVAEDTLFGKMNFKIDDVVNGTRKRLIGGLQEWGLEIMSMKKFVNDHMASFFHFKKHENLELATLLGYKLTVTTQYKKKAAELDKVKQKLFDAKDPTKWKIDMARLPEDFNDMFSSFPKIRPHMLPEESKPVDELAAVISFLNKHLLFEYVNFYLNSHYYIEQNFKEFGRKVVQSYQQNDLIWNMFLIQETGVPVVDREATSIVKSMSIK